MKKIAAISTTFGYYLLSASGTFAQTIQINRPTLEAGKNIGYADLSQFLNAALTLVFIVALLAVTVMLIWGAVEWIFSGGNKEAYGKARDRILHALVGLAILAVAFAIVKFAGQFVGVDIIGKGLPIPTPPPGP